jgi:uncharacterized protein YaiE (UPF0345 family)
VTTSITSSATAVDGTYPISIAAWNTSTNTLLGTIGSVSYVVQAGAVSTAFASLSGTTLTISLSSTGDTTIGTNANNAITVIQGNQTASFPSSSVTSITVNGSAFAENFDYNGPITQPITFNGGGGADTIIVASGTYNQVADPSPVNANLSYIVYPGTTLSFNSSAHIGTLINQGTTVIAQGANKVLTIKNLSMPSTGKIDIKDNSLIYDYIPGNSPLGTWNGTAYTGLMGNIVSGYNNKTWTGNGITSSMANGTTKVVGAAEATNVLKISSAQTGTYKSETVDGSAVIVRYTYGGDANLDGKVNVDDYVRVDSNVGLAGSNGYYNGDLNYDGKVNVDDYVIIDSNVGIQGPQL